VKPPQPWGKLNNFGLPRVCAGRREGEEMMREKARWVLDGLEGWNQTSGYPRWKPYDGLDGVMGLIIIET